MLIICPDCATSYEVRPEELGARGRKVRCSECGAEWRAAGETKTEASPELSAADVFEAEEAEEAFDVEEVEPAGAASVRAEDLPVEDVAAPAPRRRRRKPTRARAAAKPRLAAMLAGAGMASLAVLGIWRQEVVRLVPDLAGLYAAAGLPVNLRGLEFRDMNTVETVEGGVPLLIVRGTIANVTLGSVDVPRLRLAVRGRSGREIFVWTAMPSKSELKAGEALPFLAQLSSPPADGREVAVRFLSGRDAAQQRAVR